MEKNNVEKKPKEKINDKEKLERMRAWYVGKVSLRAARGFL